MCPHIFFGIFGWSRDTRSPASSIPCRRRRCILVPHYDRQELVLGLPRAAIHGRQGEFGSLVTSRREHFPAGKTQFSGTHSIAIRDKGRPVQTFFAGRCERRVWDTPSWTAGSSFSVMRPRFTTVIGSGRLGSIFTSTSGHVPPCPDVQVPA